MPPVTRRVGDDEHRDKWTAVETALIGGRRCPERAEVSLEDREPLRQLALVYAEFGVLRNDRNGTVLEPKRFVSLACSRRWVHAQC